ncbi:MAG: PAS domain S-box protein [Solirubrobacterales bacterium]
MTTRNQAQAAATDSELQQLWQLSFQKTTRGIALGDADGLLVAVNPAFARMHGGTPDDFIGRPFRSCLAPADAEQLPQLAEQLERDEFTFFEATYRRLDGSTFPAATEGLLIRGEDGRPLYRIAWLTDLSARNEEERRRREAEHRFETAFSRAAGMALAGIDGRWLRVNPAFCEMTGYAAEELYGLTYSDITHPDDLAATREADAGLLAGEVNGYELEKRYVRKSGETVWVSLAVGLLRDEEGEPLHYVVTAQDVSLRKRMEEDLARSAPGAAVDRDLMCMVSGEGRIVRLEGGWRDVLGWERAELVGRELAEYLHPEDREATVRELSGLARIEAGWRTVRNRFRTRNGNWSWLIWSAIGQPDGRVACAVREANERVAIEQVLDLRGEMIANMGEGVCLVTTDNQRIVFANPSLERMLAYGPGELIGRRAPDVMVPDDLTPEEEAEREEALRCLQEQGQCTYEGRRVRRDGATIWCRTTTTTFEHPRYGSVWVAVLQDMTEERRAREAATELERAKSEFLGSVSHELRTPLTSILGYAALLREDTEGVVDAGDHIDVIERNAGRQLRLVEDLLSIARIQAGEFEVHRLPLDLAEVVRLAVEAMRPAAKEAGLRLELECEGPARVLGDADRLEQVLTNLLTNAIKFTPRGGRVEVRLGAGPEEATLTVADTGPGIQPRDRARLFERLFRSDDVKRLQVSGAGLGLAIARSIVEAHDGTIEVRSDSGGATFAITLPLA